MNQHSRKSELQKIAKENYYILRRIQDKKPSYQFQKLKDEWKENYTYMLNIQQFKPNGQSPCSSTSSFTNKFRSSTAHHKNRSSQQNYFLSNSISAKRQQRLKNPAAQSQSNSFEAKSKDQLFGKKVRKMSIYKKTRKIGGEYFTVEVYFQKGKLFIVADEVEGSQSRVIEIPENDAYKFLKEECDNDIESLVLRLRLQNNKLYLIGTKSINFGEG